MGILLAILFLEGMVGLAPNTAAARAYTSTEFGMQVPIIDGLPVCNARHGPLIYLDRNAKPDCDGSETSEKVDRAIQAEAYFNTVDDEDRPSDRDLDGVFEIFCSDCSEGEAPAGLAIPHHVTKAAVAPADPGVVDIEVFARTGPKGSAERGSNYVFSLVTTPEREAADLKVFRRFLRRVVLWEPNAPDGGGWSIH